MGFCCEPSLGPGKADCQTNPTKDQYCSNGVVTPKMKYAFCPRKTDKCGTKAARLYPLLNQNQSIILNTSMTRTNSDVCWFELNLDSEQWA